MNMRKTLALSTLLALAALPFTAQAAGPGRAMDACIDAFVDQYIPKDRNVQVRKRLPAPSPLDVLTRSDHYTIALEARSKRTGEQLAQARCVASVHGVVIVLDSPPIESYIARADFRAVLSR